MRKIDGARPGRRWTVMKQLMRKFVPLSALTERVKVLENAKQNNTTAGAE